MERLPQAAVDTDHALEAAHESASEKLGQHRWHWTLDETNPERVSIRSYARAVGRSHTVIEHYVRAYEDLRGNPGVATFNERVRRAKVSEEQQSVTEAVAAARGIGYRTADEHRRTEIRRVRQAATEAAERKGTSVAEEAPTIAAFIVKTEQAEQQQREERESRLGVGYIAIERWMLAALRDLQEAVRVAGTYRLPDDEQTLLKHTINQVREVLHLLDQRVTGATAIDWDAELAAIMEGVER